jgi:RelE toxin of RelE / RelB toxin-antitoxin system
MKSKRVFKTRHFHRWMRKTDLIDRALCTAVSEMENGLIDADLGGGVVKKWVPLPGRGKSGSTASGWAAMAIGKTPCSLAYGRSGHFPQRLVRRFIEAALDSGGAGGGRDPLLEHEQQLFLSNFDYIVGRQRLGLQTD